MRTLMSLKKPETYLVLAVCAVLMLEVAFVFSNPFLADDFDTPTAAADSWSRASDTPEPSPASLEPALRTLDGVVSHG